jgi:hypothetical protein
VKERESERDEGRLVRLGMEEVHEVEWLHTAGVLCMAASVHNPVNLKHTCTHTHTHTF